MSHRFSRLAAAALTIVTVTATAALTASLTASAATTEVVNVADRGASAYAPENTIAAINEAKTRNADTVKIDVQATKDGRLIVMHDATLARTTNVEAVFPGRGPWNVSDFTLAEVRQLDAGSWFSPEFTGERVPTLDEALKALLADQLGVLVEPRLPQLTSAVAANVKDALGTQQNRATAGAGDLGPFIVQSSDENFLRALHKLAPWLPTGLVGTPSADRLPELARFVDLIDTPQADITAGYVTQIHQQGLKSFTWTVNNATIMRQVIDAGVDGVLTARPDVLDGVLSAAPAAA